MTEFLCTKCGACCRNVGGWGLPHDENGVCLNLNKQTNECRIYETRPDICKVDVMFEKVFKSTMTKKEFYIENTKACHFLIDLENLSDDFKVDTKEYDK